MAWRKFGVSMKLPLSYLAEKRFDGYVEAYFALRHHSFFIVTFMARMVDVPLYRHEVDAMIRSIVFEDGGGKKGAPGAKTEL